MINSWDEVPGFSSEEEERRWWDGHETSEEMVDQMGSDPEAEAKLSPPREYSGKVNLRMPKSLHRDLARKASEEGVSLNQLMITVLARSVGETDK